MNQEEMKVRMLSKVLCIVALLSCSLIACPGCKKSKQQVDVKLGTCEVIERLPSGVIKPIEVNFEDKIKLLGVDWKKVSKEQLEISYYWQLIGNPGEFREVFVHFTGSNDNLLFQNDHKLCLNQNIDDLKGKLVKQTNNIFNMPDSVKGKDVLVKIGLYDILKSDYPRLKIKSSKGALVDDKDSRVVAGNIRFN